MAQYNTTNFKSLYGAAGSTFPTNTTEEITASDFRQFGEDLADSFGNLIDVVPIRFGGNWTFPAGAFPVATYAGTLYVATADKGVPGDPDYVATGTRMMSLTNGANTYAGYTYW
jgi:hypothetical protein